MVKYNFKSQIIIDLARRSGKYFDFTILLKIQGGPLTPPPLYLYTGSLVRFVRVISDRTCHTYYNIIIVELLSRQRGHGDQRDYSGVCACRDIRPKPEIFFVLFWRLSNGFLVLLISRVRSSGQRENDQRFHRFKNIVSLVPTLTYVVFDKRSRYRLSRARRSDFYCVDSSRKPYQFARRINTNDRPTIGGNVFLFIKRRTLWLF